MPDDIHFGLASAAPVEPKLRWMVRRDFSQVLHIEDESFENPWREDDFLRVLRQRNSIGIVAELADKIIGYSIYEMHKTRYHVLNLAVDPHHRRQGIGTALIARLQVRTAVGRRARILLEVRETNVRAQLFFRNCGFRAVSVLRGFYDDTTEDAYLMQFRAKVAGQFRAE